MSKKIDRLNLKLKKLEKSKPGLFIKRRKLQPGEKIFLPYALSIDYFMNKKKYKDKQTKRNDYRVNNLIYKVDYESYKYNLNLNRFEYNYNFRYETNSKEYDRVIGLFLTKVLYRKALIYSRYKIDLLESKEEEGKMDKKNRIMNDNIRSAAGISSDLTKKDEINKDDKNKSKINFKIQTDYAAIQKRLFPRTEMYK